MPGILTAPVDIQVVPLFFEGALLWTNEGVGLPVPLQSVRPSGSIALSIPVSDHQLASFENHRAQKEPEFKLLLTAIGQDANGKVRRYYHHGGTPANLAIPRDRWLDVLDKCGFGRIRIIELPAPPQADDEEWSRCADLLAKASRDFSASRYGEAMSSLRVVSQHMVEILERSLGITPPNPSIKPRVEALSANLRDLHEKRGADPFYVISELIEALFGFTSEPSHRGFDVVTREDAEFALSLATSLYAYLARRPISLSV